MRSTPQNISPNTVLLNERTSTVLGGEKFRYGFNGMQKDDEVAGQGNSYTAEFWQYDSRLGRRWNLDPVFKEHESPYTCFANNPIWFIDPNGADTLAGNKLERDIKSLESLSKDISKLRGEILSQIERRDEIKTDIENTSDKQDLSELLLEFNPYKSNPITGPLGAHTKGNGSALTDLKLSFLAHEFDINIRIDNFNSLVDEYNIGVLGVQLELKVMDSDDNIALKIGHQIYQRNNFTYLEQNNSEQRAAYRVNVNGESFRFGFIPTSQATEIRNLSLHQKIGNINYSFNLLMPDEKDLMMEMAKGIMKK